MISKSPHSVTEEEELVSSGWGTGEAAEKNSRYLSRNFLERTGRVKPGKGERVLKNAQGIRPCVRLTGATNVRR